jgi:predicted extracellular nuclease
MFTAVSLGPGRLTLIVAPVSRIRASVPGVIFACVAWACQGTAPPDEAPAGAVLAPIDANAAVVISQVFGGGGNTAAPFKNDFVELFNRSGSAVSIQGWSIQYASASGTGNFSQNGVVVLNGVLQPGQRYLVQLGGGTTGAALPTPDAVGTILAAAASGKVALARVSTGLACNSVASCTASGDLASIVDLVGYGSANSFEGSSAAPTLSNSTAAVRANGGCTDTNQNGADYSAGAPNPRNAASPSTPCFVGNVPPQVAGTVPVDGAANVAADASLSVTFTEDVTASGSWFTLVCTGSGNVVATLSGGPQAYSLAPSVPLQSAETCTLTILAASIVDSEGLTMESDYSLSFTTAAPATTTPIHTIQGASQASPLDGSLLTTRGVVTGLRSNGYFLQDPSPDSDPATSEGIFVFTSSAPTVAIGDDVRVSGTIEEYFAADDSLPQTELSSVSAQVVLSQGNALPAPVVVGQGGRVPPQQVIEDDANGDVTSVPNTFDIASDGLDFYESLESMRVQVSNVVAVGRTQSFSGTAKELAVVLDEGANAGPRTPRGGIIISPSDFNPERLLLGNDLLTAMPSANVGDRLPGTIVGVLSYTFGNPKLLYTQPLPSLVPGGLAQESWPATPRRPHELDVAAFNVENLDAADPQSKFDQLASIVVQNLRSPDVIALEEIQDNDGATNSSVVDSTQTLNKLVAAIDAANAGVVPKPVYQFAVVNPVDDQDGGEPGGNIRVAFLYRTDRGLGFSGTPGGSTTANTVTGSGASTSLAFNPGRIAPTNAAFSSSRKPLAAQFEFQGRRFFVIANHFNSKGGDNPLFGRYQPPVLGSEVQRNQQANLVKGFVQQLLAASPQAEIVVLGDLNDFEFSAPLLTLKSAGLSALIERLPQNERYTYVYQGNSQALDHILVSTALTAHVVSYDVVHVNSEFATQASDHDPGVARLSFDRTPPVITPPSVSPTVTASGPNGAVVSFTVSASDVEDGPLPVTCTPASGSLFPVGATPVSCVATDAGGNQTQVDFTVTVRAAAASAPAAPLAALGALGTLLLALGQRRLRRGAGPTPS